MRDHVRAALRSRSRVLRGAAMAAILGLTPFALAAQGTAPAAGLEEAPVSGEAVTRAYNDGDYDIALALSSRRIAQLEREGAEQDLVRARSSHGAILLQLERFDEARASLLRAAEAGERLLGADAPSTLNARYNYAMTYYHEEDYAAAVPLLETALSEWLEMLGRDPLLDRQLYDPGAITRLESLAIALQETGQGARAASLLRDDLQSINISIGELDQRTGYLTTLFEAFEGEGRAGELAGDELDSFVSRTRGLGGDSLDGKYAVLDQRDIQRRVYEAAGLADQALAAAAQNPDYVSDRFNALAGSDPAAALAFLDQVIAFHTAECPDDYCYEDANFFEILLIKSDYLIAEGRAGEAIPALRRMEALSRYSSRIEDWAKREVKDTLARVLADAGQPGEALAMSLRAEGIAADPDLAGNVELTIARRLRAAGHGADADAIVTLQMDCIFPKPGAELAYHTPCASGWAAMHEYADILDQAGKRREAEYYRLPHQIDTAWKARADDEAKAKARRFVDVALALWEPEDYRTTLAIKVFSGQHSWYDLPLYDIPRKWRICGRWDEPLPPAPEPEVDPMMPTIAAPAFRDSRTYLPLGYGPATALDPYGVFYRSLTNRAGGSFDKYIGQCAAAGDPEAAIRFADWALGKAGEFGYPIRDQEALWLEKARLEAALYRYDDAEKSLLTVVDRYLSGQETSGEVFDPNKAIVRLIQFYGQLGRGERLLALLTRMSESGQFGEGYGSSQASRPLREMLYPMFVAMQDFDRARDLLATLGPWERIVEAESRGTTGAELEELKAREFTAYAMRLVELENTQGNLAAALKVLDEAQAMNEAYLAQHAPDPEREPMARFLLNGQIHAQRAGIFARQGREADALAELERTGLFVIGDRLLALVDEAVQASGSITASELIASEAAKDQQMGALMASLSAAYASAAEFSMRTGDEDKAVAYFEKARRFPSSDAWSQFEQVTRWVGVSLAIARPEWRERGLADATALVTGLERQWGLASRNSLDSGFLRDSLSAAPAYFGDVLTLRALAEAEGLAKADEEAAFRHLQWSIMSVTDLSIAQSAAKTMLARTDPAILALLTKRDQIARTLYSRENVALQSQPTYDSRPREQVFAAKVQSLRAIDDELRTAYPEYFEITSSEPVALDRVRGALTEDEALLLVSPGRYATHMMLVTRDGLKWKQSPLTQEQLAGKVRILRYFLGATTETELDALERSDKEAFDAVMARAEQVDGGWQGYDRATAKELYDVLIAPFADQLKGRDKLIVSPGGPLAGLPFAALVREIAPGRDDDPAALRATRYLIDDAAITQIPALSSFILLREQGGAYSARDVRFMGFGDPLLEGGTALRGSRSPEGATDQGEEVAAVWSGDKINLQRLRKMKRLPGTRAELEAMQLAFGAGADSVMLAEAATETRVKQANLREVDVLAFATHGVMAGEIPGATEPGLVFTPPTEATALDDGYLTASEVAQLVLNTDWVILSACNTASADGSLGAPALSGLAKSFFHAGARGLLVSHWYIRDDVASELTVRAIVTQRRTPGMSRAEALRDAMLSIRDDPKADGKVRNRYGELVEGSWAHPNAWAALTLISGD